MQNAANENAGTGLPAVSGPVLSTPAEVFQGEASSGIFQAQVTTAQRAIPVPNAKIILRRGGEVAAFLITDESGLSRSISLPAPPQKNTLDPASGARSADYTADVSADGFTSVTGLLVSMVGGADSMLRIDLIPLPEGGV